MTQLTSLTNFAISSPFNDDDKNIKKKKLFATKLIKFSIS